MQHLTTLKYAALGLAFTGLLSCSQAQSETAGSMTDDAFGERVRTYLLENPEVLIEAFTVLETKRVEAESAQKLAMLPSILEQSNAPSIGPEDAPITIIEFFDYNCTFCKQSTNWIVSQLNHENNDVRVIFMDLPLLENRYKTSVLAARAALAAHKQGKYLDMHTALMSANGLTKSRILGMAESIGLDTVQLEKDMDSAEIYRSIEDAAQLAEAAGIQATPGFFVNDAYVAGYNGPHLQDLVDKARKQAG